MKYFFDVLFSPTLNMEEHDCRVVVDLLRASTQMTTFFDVGGEAILPVTTPEAARATALNLGSEWKLMGERGGIKIDGFDFGNSPLALMAQGAPRFAVMTTSNGTGALLRAADSCKNVLAGCARNAQAVAWHALCKGNRIGIVAAGREGMFSIEDTACAGMIVERMLTLAPANGGSEMELSDGAIAALALWKSFGRDIEAISFDSEHGRILQNIGADEDIIFCCETDASASVPKVTRREGLLLLTGS